MRTHAFQPFQQLLIVFLKKYFFMKINVLKSTFKDKTYLRKYKCGKAPISADR